MISILFTLGLSAQNSEFEIVGQLNDTKDSSSLPYVTIQTYLNDTASTPVFSCISDNFGKFKIRLSTQGEYYIVFSYLGKQTLIKNISLKSDNYIDLGNLEMADQNTELGAVNIVGQRPLVNVSSEKLIYNVSEDSQALNSTLLTIAEKVPLININREIGLLLNNCKPLILINGRKLKSVNNNPVFYLKNTAASNIEKIEVVTNPGSKYDADVRCGVVNIITKKNRESSLMMGSETDSNLGYGIFTDFGFKYNKLTINGNLTYNSTHKFDVEQHTQRLNKQETQNYKFIQNGESKRLNNDISKALSFDLSYEFDTLNNLSFSTGYYQNDFSDTLFQENSMNDFSNNLIYSYNSQELSNIKWGNYNVGSSYEFISKNKRNNLVVSALKEVEFVNRSNVQLTLPVFNYSFSSLDYIHDEKQDENTMQIDFVHNFKNNSQLSAGAKAIFRDNTSISEKQLINNTSEIEKHENFQNMQHVYALYSEYKFKILEEYSINTGLRFESTRIDGGYENDNANDFTANYSNLLPYILISKKTSKGILFSTGYNSKISRPNVYALNPTILALDQQSIYYGNPDLTSEYLSTFSLNYTNRLKRIKQNAKLSYIFSNNSIQNISGITNDVYYTTYTNEGKFNELKLNLNLSSTIATWLQLRFSGSGSYVNVWNDEMKNSGFTGTLNSTANITLPNDYYIGMSGMYIFPTINLQGSDFSFYICDINASKAFLKDKLNVELRLSNPFWKTKKYSKRIETNEMRILSDVLNMGRKLSISISYTFNNNYVRANKTSKSIENSDLKGSQGAQ